MPRPPAIAAGYRAFVLTVTTRPVADPGALLDLLPAARGGCAWVRGADGLVGWGVAARFRLSGEHRFAAARERFAEFTEGLEVRDELGIPGTGPVAFASFAFADDPGDSVLVVPKVLFGRRDGMSWMTTVGEPEEFGTEPVRVPAGVRYADSRLTVEGYKKAVQRAVQRIRAGELDKVVLAHDLLAHADEPLDERGLLGRLATNYPTCWTYAVDGLIGATPELLLRRTGEVVSARLLAGTVWPRAGVTDFDQLASELLASAKNLGEHRYGIESLVACLEPYCSRLDVPDGPSVLRLPNVAHLATEVHGTLRAETSLLELTAKVHPTAAVGGTPTAAAVRAIAELEGMDRGRYAGPVGWLDAHGDGEFGIALRCAQLSGSTARLYAGGGIVADSEPDNEAAEAAAKFRPVRSALEG